MPLERYRVTTFLVVLFLLLGGSRADVGSASTVGSDAHLRPGEILVHVRDGVAVASVARRAGVGAADLVSSRISRLAVPPGQERARARALSRDPDVIAAAPNYVRRAQLVPNDPLYSQQWALPKIRAPEGWDVTTGAASVVVAILDSGVDEDHPDLAGKLLPGRNTLGVAPEPVSDGCAVTDSTDDDFGHGTHVAGIAAAATNNATGVAGVSWGAQILPVKVLDCRGVGDDAHIIAGIDWAVESGARLINLSIGGPGQSDVLDAAVERAWRAGVLVIAAAGNSATTEPYYPAASPHALAVAATDGDDRLAPYSNRGSYVDITAPGGSSSKQILSTVPPSAYGYKQGTSMASPFVAGAAALVWSLYPTHSPDRVAGALFAAAEKIETCPTGVSSCPYVNGRNDYYGHGRLDVARALTIAPQVVGPLVPRASGLN